MSQDRRNRLSMPGVMVVVACLLTGASPTIGAISVNFDDGTTGALNAQVTVSKQSFDVGVMNDAHGLPDPDKELYITWSYGSPGQDRAVIDTNAAFSDVVAGDVVGFYATDPLGGAGGGVVAGMPAGGGSGYLCYLTRNFGYDVGPGQNAGGIFWDASVAPFDSYELIVVRKNAGTDWPLSAGNVWSAVQVTGVAQDTPNFVRLTVKGTQLTGEVWLGQSSPVGVPSAAVSLTDPAPLSGYTGVYLATRNAQAPYVTNWGVAAVDDFGAVVPEPAALALLALAAGVIRGRRRR